MASDVITQTGILGSEILADALPVPEISAISLLRASREILTHLPWALISLAVRERSEPTKCAHCQEVAYLLRIGGRTELVDLDLTTVSGRLVVPFHRCQPRGGAA